MELYMSKESLDAVKAKPIYEQLKAKFTVVAFLKLIKEVHRTEPAVRSSADAVADALQEFQSIKKSTDESLIDYKNRMSSASKQRTLLRNQMHRQSQGSSLGAWISIGSKNWYDSVEMTRPNMRKR